jgi:hypothetical protein
MFCTVHEVTMIVLAVQAATTTSSKRLGERVDERLSQEMGHVRPKEIPKY